MMLLILTKANLYSDFKIKLFIYIFSFINGGVKDLSTLNINLAFLRNNLSKTENIFKSCGLSKKCQHCNLKPPYMHVFECEIFCLICLEKSHPILYYSLENL